MLRQLTALEPPLPHQLHPPASFCTINKSFANRYLGFFRVGVCVCRNAPRVICCKNRCDSANVSLGECDLGAHDAPRAVAWSEKGGLK